ncbi:MAG: enoyl-CoA hydratase-related protein [Dehalococcoidia bacterium]
MALIYEKKGKVAYFTFNRPEALNAFNPDQVQEFSQALIDFRDGDAVWVGIVTGMGERAFCAGADIKTLLPKLQGEWSAPGAMPPNIMRGLEVYKPMIAAINGFALGGGLEVALACDIRIASEKAAFGVPEVKLGLVPGWGGCSRLPRVIPSALAAQMLLTGDPIPAQEAYRIGLVNQVVSPEELMPTAEKWAERLCGPGPLAVRKAKEVMVKTQEMSLTQSLALEWDGIQGLYNSQDATEGINAFVEKRKAEFKAK